jgi:hypothetical protein
MYCHASTGSSVARRDAPVERQLEMVGRVERSWRRVREGVRCEKLSRLSERRGKRGEEGRWGRAEEEEEGRSVVEGKQEAVGERGGRAEGQEGQDEVQEVEGQGDQVAILRSIN